MMRDWMRWAAFLLALCLLLANGNTAPGPGRPQATEPRPLEVADGNRLDSAALARVAPTSQPDVIAEPSPAPSTTSSAEVVDQPLPDRAERVDEYLTSELETYLQHLDGAYGIAAYSFTTGQTVRIADADVFPAASLYKVIVLYETYRRIEEGQISLDHEIGIDASDLVEDDSAGLEPGDWISVDTALRLMITISSNAAAHALLDELGWSSFNAAAARLGLDETRMPVGGYGLQFDDWRQTITSTSPRDMLRFFKELGRHQLVSSEASVAMLEILLEQQVDDRIPAGLPDGVSIAHKTGELDGVRNDAGIVFAPSGAYVLVVLSQNSPEDEAVEAIAEIARRVHARYGAGEGS